MCFGVLEEVKGVSSYISNEPIWEVCSLPGGDDSIQDGLEPGGQDSRGDFVEGG